jgi:predicted PurR-regulated permease PerM
MADPSGPPEPPAPEPPEPPETGPPEAEAFEPELTLEHVDLVDSTVRTVIRNVLTILTVIGVVYLVYLLRQPLGWLILATGLAVTLAGPVNRLARHMRRGFAILVVYLGVLAIPFALGALVVPPVITQASNLANDAPHYAQQVTDYVQKNKRLRDLDEKYDISGSLQDQAAKLPNKVGDAAGTLSNIGLSLIHSIFALVTILILSAFMVASGQSWVDAGLRLQPAGRAERLERVLSRIALAIRSYVAGALAVATIDGLMALLVMEILGVPFAVPLAVMAGLFALIPLVGATIAAVIIGVITLFNDFPTATIIWTVYAILYQQIENTIIQPQIQRRAVDVNAFVVLVAVLFGSTLFGIPGALVAIPIAASIQIIIREFWDFRVEMARARGRAPGPPPRDEPGPAPAPEPA